MTGAPISCNFTADPPIVILPDNNSTLYWNCINTQGYTCNISPEGGGSIALPQGSAPITPNADTVYTLDCSGVSPSPPLTLNVDVEVASTTIKDVIP